LQQEEGGAMNALYLIRTVAITVESRKLTANQLWSCGTQRATFEIKI
jgi:hypothetical protein